MSKYTRATHFAIEFEGDTIAVSMLRIKRSDFMKMAPHIKTDDDGEVVMSMGDKMKFMDLISDMLPKYVKKFDGLVDEDGEPLTLKDILDESYFMDIHTKLVTKLFASSGLAKPDEDVDEDEVDDAEAERRQEEYEKETIKN